MPFFYATRRDGDRVEILGPDARHLANIFNKLGLASRTAAATFALRAGLV